MTVAGSTSKSISESMVIDSGEDFFGEDSFVTRQIFEGLVKGEHAN